MLSLISQCSLLLIVLRKPVAIVSQPPSHLEGPETSVSVLFQHADSMNVLQKGMDPTGDPRTRSPSVISAGEPSL